MVRTSSASADQHRRQRHDLAAPQPSCTAPPGKGHLGYPSTAHMPIRRGYASHVGYLGGSEAYDQFHLNSHLVRLDPCREAAGQKRPPCRRAIHVGVMPGEVDATRHQCTDRGGRRLRIIGLRVVEAELRSRGQAEVQQGVGGGDKMGSGRCAPTAAAHELDSHHRRSPTDVRAAAEGQKPELTPCGN